MAGSRNWGFCGGVVFLLILGLSFPAGAGFTPVDLNPVLETGQYVQKLDSFVVLFDASLSMEDKLGKQTKFEYAKEVLNRMNQTIPNLKLTGAIRTFGAGASRFGTRTELVYGPEAYTRDGFEKALDRIKYAAGDSPLHEAVKAAAEDFKDAPGKLGLLVFSDGELMDDKPIEEARKLEKEYRDRLCIYTVFVGESFPGEVLMEQMPRTVKCGFFTHPIRIYSSEGMAEYVKQVFLQETPDSDMDGVHDPKDVCPDTPAGIKVDARGCPEDSDGDGVPDYLDRCPDTPKEAQVDEMGCPKDADGDGVPDYLDECPGTPKGVAVDDRGCAMDADGDGVPDYRDVCPDTPKDIAVDERGCPKDADSDTVFDYLDECPDTPRGVMVDEKGCPKDTDGDGIPDYLDLCPGTAKGIVVDDLGCPKDSDGDGVADASDECPDTMKGLIVSENGCPPDEDKDGVYDYLDECPKTPAGVAVDKRGCPKDTDGDGVPDYLDQCPETPVGAVVDELGCPKDSDGDGVPDYRDLCPDTPPESVVDERGCVKEVKESVVEEPVKSAVEEPGKPAEFAAGPPAAVSAPSGGAVPVIIRVPEKAEKKDTDGDGVIDDLDECPDTPTGVAVDKRGCPLDSDKDGVPDYLDKCPDTPACAPVDKEGCPLDTDGDGVADYLDQCPGTPAGARVDDRGCWSVGNVLFDFDKSVVKRAGYPLLDAVADILKKNSELVVDVQGHTDNVGTESYNRALALRRAVAVRRYLVNKGIDGSRLPVSGYGFTIPVATNGTAEGRTENRRVEFHPLKDRKHLKNVIRRDVEGAVETEAGATRDK